MDLALSCTAKATNVAVKKVFVYLMGFLCCSYSPRLR
ncbi:hypothetical protein NECAME_12241 [Necator americanus]|uniref:Uncharacterized protein n=1 Tax=Necator americanus TaxID=51031 RepID=W2T217_NECAM|nr:hypothetical protein NECAME_12241 [Necator americanus]ETN75619.1 hypothetical protein NECAME_12241 [Necator americanus]